MHIRGMYLRVILYETRIKRTVISLLDVDDIDQLIQEHYSHDTDLIPVGNSGIYRIAFSSTHRYKNQTPCCWKTSADGEPTELIVGTALFVKKDKASNYKSLTDKDIVYITRRYRPYDFCAV